MHNLLTTRVYRLFSVGSFLHGVKKLRIWTYIAITFSIMMIILCMVIAFEPNLFESYNNILKESTSIFIYLSMIFSLFALLIASFALLNAIRRPKLEFKLYTYDHDDEGPALAIQKENRIVTNTRPLSFWNMWINNVGDVAARNTMIQINFKGMYFKENFFPDWKAVHHDHGLGWYGFQYSPEIIHPHFPMRVPDMYFSGSQVLDDCPELTVTMVADGFKLKTITMPIILKEL